LLNRQYALTWTQVGCSTNQQSFGWDEQVDVKRLARENAAALEKKPYCPAFAQATNPQ
jgi:hypothetical protein